MLAFAQFVATLSAALFTGAAVYVNLVEHPARLSCGTKVAATEFGPSYKRAAVLQASLSFVSFVAGVAAWRLGGDVRWLVGAVLIGLAIPYTLVVVKPTNDQLLDPARNPTSVETHMLLQRWGWLHGVRSVLSLAATILYLYLLV